ncbi:hypothetical protein VCV18_001616 [Metarhizium anisopliae]
MTDVRKSMTATDPTSKHKRPGMTRRHTPVNAQKLGRSHREREREHQDAWEDERESFPQYWEPGTKGHHTTGFTIATKFDALQPVAAGIARDDSSLSSHLRPLCAAISQHWTS